MLVKKASWIKCQNKRDHSGFTKVERVYTEDNKNYDKGDDVRSQRPTFKYLHVHPSILDEKERKVNESYPQVCL